MLSVLAPLVLGLVIATVKTSYDATDTAVRAYCTDLIVLDETLRDYGDGAPGPRRQLRDHTMKLMYDLWPVESSKPMLVEDREAGELMEQARESIRALMPGDAGQKWLMDQALQMTTSLLRERRLMAEHSGPSVHPVVIVILVSWIVVIFASFGLNAPRATSAMRTRVIALEHEGLRLAWPWELSGLPVFRIDSLLRKAHLAEEGLVIRTKIRNYGD